MSWKKASESDCTSDQTVGISELQLLHSLNVQSGVWIILAISSTCVSFASQTFLPHLFNKWRITI